MSRIQFGVITAILVCIATGCAAALQGRAPDRGGLEAVHDAPSCSTTKWWIVDAGLLAASLTAAVAGQFVGGDTGTTTTGVSLFSSILFTASLDTGIAKWRGCTAAHYEWNYRQAASR